MRCRDVLFRRSRRSARCRDDLPALVPALAPALASALAWSKPRVQVHWRLRRLPLELCCRRLASRVALRQRQPTWLDQLMRSSDAEGLLATAKPDSPLYSKTLILLPPDSESKQPVAL